MGTPRLCRGSRQTVSCLMRRSSGIRCVRLWLIVVAIGCAAATARAGGPAVFPERISLPGPMSRQQLVVSLLQEGRIVDATASATFASSDPKVAEVNERGVVA